MNSTQRGLIALLGSAIREESLPLPPDFQLEQAMETIRRHGMVTLAYAGAVRCGLDRQEAAMQQLFGLYCQALIRSEAQMEMLKDLLAAFDRAGIHHLPLKGSRMKALYPSQELRLMGDADILIRMDQYPGKLRPVLESLGFAFERESDYELIWNSRALHLELHKCLLPPDHRDFYRYFGSGWDRAVPEAGCRYAMTPEAEAVYLFAHFSRHFRDGGIGCRHVADLWVYDRAHPALDREAVCRELEKLGLREFYGNIRRMYRAWFEDGPWDDRSEFLTDYIFASGSWGRMESRTVAYSLHGPGRLGYLLRTAFPGVLILREKYTVLKKAPWLLPLVWLYRPFYKLFFERGSLSRHRRNLALLNRENLTRQRELLRYAGLRDDF